MLLKVKQVGIFVGMLILYLIASGLIENSVIFHGWLRYVLLAVGIVGSIGVAYFLAKLIKRAEPEFSILPINFKNWRRFVWLLLIWIGSLFVMGTWKSVGDKLIGVSIESTSTNQELISKTFSYSGFYSVIAMAITLVLVAPIIEELLFRGLFLAYFDSKKHWWIGVVTSGLLFGLAHIVSSGVRLASLVDWIMYAILGGALAFVYKRTRHISNDILIHMMQNSIATLSLLITFLQH
ncbi:CPBP family intramembrane glutamic endopeptidase [Eupransor demetentiae]|uniref:CAAX protease family (YdiL) n=1 Tax=Eupransor demetentiae TaxID=3109584 RepID=A0ABM9N6C1_9LACO|nr:CAAX protease family (YdiL) [Lactobacillaceae bacterium LMG 33000]